MTVHIQSFGYGHPLQAPEADITIDARRFRNPHKDPRMRYLTGLDQPVRDHVLDTPGIAPTVAATIQRALELLRETSGPVTVAVGCVGGRHRSVVLASEIGAGLHARGFDVVIEHRDVARPVLPSTAHGGLR